MKNRFCKSRETLNLEYSSVATHKERIAEPQNIALAPPCYLTVTVRVA